MLVRLLMCIAACVLTTFPAASATFEYPVVITDISGDGAAQNIGFFRTATVGEIGTGSARTDSEFPTTVPTQFFDASLFGVVFPGVASAASFFANPVVHDPLAGTVTVNGSLGGLTGPYDAFVSASAFEFVYTGAPGAIASLADYETFLDSATMSGFVSAFFTPDSLPDSAFLQRIDFRDATPVPLPAGAVLLLSGLGLLMVGRSRREGASADT